MNTSHTLNALLKAGTIAEVGEIVQSLPAAKTTWLPFGGSTGNKGPIKFSTDPIRALVERITNSIDAVIERGIEEAGINDPASLLSGQQKQLALDSPQAAVARYVPSKNEPFWGVTVTPQANWAHSTVDIFDRGVGIRPEFMPDTILSLSGSNKISKRYQAGMYGMGGATSIGKVVPEGYAIIVTRAKNSPIGFTVVRYEQPSDNDKRGYYTYLADANTGLPLMVDESFVTSKNDKDEFRAGMKLTVPKDAGHFPQGTLVRHLGYDLSVYRSQSRYGNESSMYRALNTYLFDALLPGSFRLLEKSQRSKSGAEWHARIIQGSRSRLLDKSDTTVEYATKEPVVISLGKNLGSVELEYWVLEAMKKKDKEKGVLQLGDFVHPTRPVIFTLNGQTHGEYTLNEISPKIKLLFPYTSSSMIVHVRLDSLSPTAKDEALSSGREDLVAGRVRDTLSEEIQEVLTEDEYLNQIDFKRMEMSLTSGGQLEVAKDHELLASLAAVIKNLHKNPSMVRHAAGLRMYEPPRVLPPLPTQDPPTFIRFTKHPEEALDFSPGKKRILNVETDAVDSLAKKIKVDAEGMEVRWSMLEGGRMKISVLCPETMATGSEGRLRVTLGHLHDSVPYIVRQKTSAELQAEIVKRENREQGLKLAEEQKRGLPKFDIQWTRPGDFNWTAVLNLADEDKDTFAFDYRVKEGAGVVLYCSSVFPPFRQQMQTISNPNRAALYKKHYVAQALIHVFRRADEMEGTMDLDETLRQQIEMQERTCAATSFAFTAGRTLQLEQENVKSKSLALVA